MRRIVLSGASGFLGRNIIKRAVAEDIEVLAIAFPEEELPVEKISILDFLSNGYTFTANDVFINCLFPTNANGYQMADGLKNHYTVISRAYEGGAGALINISSQSVYDSKRKVPAKESDSLCLDTPYAVGKYSSEVYVNMVWKDRPHTNIRLSSLLGVGYNQRIVNRMIDQALNDEELRVIGGMQRYGFLDVRDAADGLVRLITTDLNKWKEVYNLGRNESYTLIDLVECIKVEMKKINGKEVRYRIEEGEDNRNSAISSYNFMESFSWHPAITLSETTAEIIANKIKATEG